MRWESHQTSFLYVKATYISPQVRGYGAKSATRLVSRQTPLMRTPTPTFLNLDHVLSLPRLLLPRMRIHISRECIDIRRSRTIWPDDCEAVYEVDEQILGLELMTVACPCT